MTRYCGIEKLKKNTKYRAVSVSLLRDRECELKDSVPVRAGEVDVSQL